jgi:hypothetical protein
MKLHDSRQLGPLVFRDPLLLCSALYFLLYFDASGFLRLGLLAAFLHECGHILVYCVFLRRFPVIEVTMTGFCMRMDAPARGLSPGRLFWLAAVGPAVNFMLAGIWALRLESGAETHNTPECARTRAGTPPAAPAAESRLHQSRAENTVRYTKAAGRGTPAAPAAGNHAAS